MKLTKILRWIGIIFLSLLFGTIIGSFSWEVFRLFVTFVRDDPTDPYSSYDLYEKQGNQVAFICFIFGSLACMSVLGLGRKVRPHLLYFSAFIINCICLLLLRHDFHLLSQNRYRVWDDPYTPDFLFESFFIIVLLVPIEVVLFMAGLLADKSNEAKDRAIRRRQRNFN